MLLEDTAIQTNATPSLEFSFWSRQLRHIMLNPDNRATAGPTRRAASTIKMPFP